MSQKIRNTAIFYFLMTFVVLHSCQKLTEETAVEQTVYTCSAEEVENGFFVDSAHQLTFKGIEARTNELALSGEYSVKVDSVNPYSFSVDINDVKEGEFFQVSVWHKKALMMPF